MMASPGSHSVPQPSANRRLLSFQWLYLLVAVVLFAIVWITDWSHADFLGVLVYSFVTGNLTTVAMTRLIPLLRSFRPSYHWPLYASCLFASALTSSALAVFVILVMYRIPFSLAHYRAEFGLPGDSEP